MGGGAISEVNNPIPLLKHRRGHKKTLASVGVFELGTNHELRQTQTSVLTLLPIDPGHAADPTASLTHERRTGRGAPMAWQMTPRMAERRARMRDVGARMLARAGLAGVAVMDIARAADVPISPAAHGYRRRPDLLFDILHAYVDALHEYVGSADEAHEADTPETRLLAVVTALLNGVNDHRDSHQLMLSTLLTLPDDQRDVLRYQMRMLVYRLAGPMDGVVPGLSARRDVRAPLLQSLIGMVNHVPAWFRDTGAMSRPAYAALITRAVIEAGRASLAA